jgi:hypothetical protein
MAEITQAINQPVQKLKKRGKDEHNDQGNKWIGGIINQN